MNTLFLLLAVAAEPVPADILIKGATIYDGSGRAGYVGDVAIAGDKIAAVGNVQVAGSPRVIDGAGLVVAPGFIDLHTHCDSGDNSVTRPVHRLNKCYLTQGVHHGRHRQLRGRAGGRAGLLREARQERGRDERGPPGPAQHGPRRRPWATPTGPRPRTSCSKMEGARRDRR